MEKFKIGNGLDQGVRIGPLTTEYSRDRLKDLIEKAQNSGARLTGKQQSLPSQGYFLAPMIASEIDPEHSLVLEEQFGPVLPVVPYQTIDQAIKWSNATTYSNNTLQAN